MYHNDCAAMSLKLQPPPIQWQKSTTAAPIGSPPSEPACQATSRTLPSRARPRIRDLQCRTLPRRISVSTCANILPGGAARIFTFNVHSSLWPSRTQPETSKHLENITQHSNNPPLVCPTVSTCPTCSPASTELRTRMVEGRHNLAPRPAGVFRGCGDNLCDAGRSQ